jgi:hypothetical protein
VINTLSNVILEQQVDGCRDYDFGIDIILCRTCRQDLHVRHDEKETKKCFHGTEPLDSPIAHHAANHAAGLAKSPGLDNIYPALSRHSRPALATPVPLHSTVPNAACQTGAGGFSAVPGLFVVATVASFQN